MRGFMTVLVVLAIGCACMAGTALAGPQGPQAASERESWSVTKPHCAMDQAWEKLPGALPPVNTVALLGKVSCTSLPSNLTVYGDIYVFDRATPLAGPVVTAQGSLGPSASPVSFSLTPALRNPKAGHLYDYEFDVSFVDSANFSAAVSGVPPQCTSHDAQNPIFEEQPPDFSDASVDCQFAEEILIP